MYQLRMLVDKEAFYSDLQRTVDKVKEKGISVILSGEFNARTGNDVKSGYGVLRLHGGENVKNNNGQRIIDFSIDNVLLIGNSFYLHERIHKITFYAK